MTHPLNRLLLLACCLVLAQPASRAEKHKKSVAKDDTAAPTEPATHALHSAMSVEEYEHLLNILFPIDHATPIGLDYSDRPSL